MTHRHRLKDNIYEYQVKHRPSKYSKKPPCPVNDFHCTEHPHKLLLEEAVMPPTDATRQVSNAMVTPLPQYIGLRGNKVNFQVFIQ